MTNAACFLLLSCLACLLQPASTSKILLLPMMFKSHVTQMVTIGNDLLDNGHDVYVVVSPSYPDHANIASGRLKVVTYEVKDRDVYGMPMEDTESMLEGLLDITPIENVRTNVDGFMQFCTNPLSDDVLFEELKSHNFDLAVVDVFPSTRCLLILCYRLGLPYIGLTTIYEPWLLRVPALPSFVPFPLAEHYTEDMDFLQRLQNTLTLLDWTVFTRVPPVDDSLVAKYAPEKPPVTLNYLAGRTLLWLFDTDITIDYPRPTMPNEVNIGGISTKPSKALPADLAEFMDGATEGVIIVTFGTFDALPLNIYEKLMATFIQVKQRVIWRYKFDFPEDVPSHIKLMKWTPQNDIMGHPNTKLLITHGGGNSQFEALYHSVPVITFPIFGDQPYNAKRAEYHGFGITMDLRTFMPDQLVRNILKITSDQSCRLNIQKRSKIFHSRPMTPRQRALHWIEHVLKFGGDHLHSSALDLPWYQYLMLDIIGFLLLVLFLGVVILCKVCKVIWRNCFATTGKDKVKVQ